MRGRLQSAAHRARGTRPVLVSVSERLAGEYDPSAIAFASRRPGEPYLCLEQPDRARMALAALGCAQELRASGPARFAQLDAAWRELCERAVADGGDGPAGAGLAAFGGFAFADDGAWSITWAGFEPASLIVPEVSLVRSGAESWITLNATIHRDEDPAAVQARLDARLRELRARPLALLDPSPVGGYHVSSPIPPVHHEQAVAHALERIRAGELAKIVLAREVQVKAPADHDPGAVFGVLRGAFPSCYSYAVGRGDATFIGATPELLVRREGQRASTVALAGSIRRSADPAVDDHLGESLMRSDKNRAENLIVARRIASALSPHALWVTVAPEPVVIKVANIQHLATPIRAQLASEASVLELAGALHPTPAVGGEPRETAIRLIPALEGLDRGWYAGAVGFTDASGDGEFCVALRCALLRGRLASCFAGGGIVAGSDPAQELAETETKLEALLPILSG